ncbi:MAG: hypothetical protein AAB655_02755 [Patescibacteria group bacterium]
MGRREHTIPLEDPHKVVIDTFKLVFGCGVIPEWVVGVVGDEIRSLVGRDGHDAEWSKPVHFVGDPERLEKS